MARVLWIAILVVSIATGWISAQSESLTESMTKDQLDEFESKSLTVEEGLGFSGSLWALRSYTRWTGSMGFQKLSEAQFYEIAGYPEQARQAARYKTTAWGLAIGGGAACLGGMLWMTAIYGYSAGDPNLEAKSNWALYGGGALMLGGMIPLFIGSFRVPKNWSSVDQAKKAADKYNRELADRIRAM